MTSKSHDAFSSANERPWNVLEILHHIQASKRDPNLNFLVRIFSGGVGVFHVKGWGPKSSVCPSKPGKYRTFLPGYPGILPGYPGGARKVWEKKVCVQIVHHMMSWASKAHFGHDVMWCWPAKFVPRSCRGLFSLGDRCWLPIHEDSSIDFMQCASTSWEPSTAPGKGVLCLETWVHRLAARICGRSLQFIYAVKTVRSNFLASGAHKLVQILGGDFFCGVIQLRLRCIMRWKVAKFASHCRNSLRFRLRFKKSLTIAVAMPWRLLLGASGTPVFVLQARSVRLEPILPNAQADTREGRREGVELKKPPPFFRSRPPSSEATPPFLRSRPPAVCFTPQIFLRTVPLFFRTLPLV